MAEQPTYEELKKRVSELEKEVEALKAVSESLRESEEKYRCILDGMEEEYYEVDLAGNFTFFNKATSRNHGYPPDELIGMNYRSYMSPGASRKIYETFSEVYRTGVPARTVSYEVVRKDGSKRIGEMSVSLIRDETGAPVGFSGISRDRTELIQTEHALRESEESYRSILGLAPDAIVIARANDGRYVQVNDAFSQMTGYSPEEAVGRTGLDLNLYPDPAERDLLLDAFRRDGRLDGFEIRFQAKDGTIMHDLVSARPIRFKGEDCVLVMATVITSLKEAQRALGESEEKYRNILQNMEEGYWECDLAGNFTFFNEAICRMHGYSRDELMGMNNRTYSSPHEAKKIYGIFKEVYRTGAPAKVFDYEIIKKDGAKRIIELSASLLRDGSGEAVGFRGISRDVTQKRMAERTLRESEEKYRLLVENASEAIYITQDGVVKFPNPRTEALTGYSTDELAKMPFLSLTHPKDRDAVHEHQDRNTEREHGTSTYSFRIGNKRGETLWVELNALPITWEGKRATLNFLRDVTPQKRMEAQLLQARKMEAIGTLAGGIAHDFNNLLMGIQGNTSLMLLDVASGHSHYENLKSIEKLVQHGSGLTKQLLGVARGGKYEVKTTDLNQLVEAGADLFSRTRKEISIHRRFQENLWPVEVDRGQIEQVLLNLYVNAWHAMPEGGELYIETKNLFLDQEKMMPYGLNSGKYVRVSVTDNGIGMNEATLKRVFDPFFTTKEMGRGTGLGLASAYGIIRNHNGIIDVYSEKGEGTTFNIYLPASDKQIQGMTVSVEAILEGTETILFVDDEETILQIGKQLLERLGYHVVVATSGPQAIEIFQKDWKKFHLVLLDMIMPGMSGGETYGHLREIDPNVRVLLSSGYSINGQAKKILERGCKGFIQKPYNLRDLSKRVRQILEESHPPEAGHPADSDQGS
jgi:two-component system cell cycle sensor histidine kinase/response regulator CckA